MSTAKKSETKTFKSNFPVVGIGASAGGIEAMTTLLESLAPDTEMAIVYLQHLPADHKTNLVEIMQRSTSMQVVLVKSDMQIEPNKLYIAPSDKKLSIKHGDFVLLPRTENKSDGLLLNSFFLSLADELREKAIGVILSGMASDGALGLKAIKSAGGITYIQDDTAKFESMPKSALAEGGVDMVLSPKEIARDLERISRKLPLFEDVLDEQQIETEEDVDGSHDKELPAILLMLRTAYGIDFTNYKKNTIKRRIIRRLLLHKLETLADYLVFLKENKEELSKLYNDLLINVTQFFRDNVTIEYLKSNILPRLLKSKTVNDPLRIWIAACSTGEEAYSMGIVIHEILGNDISALPVQIFATDLSEMAIAKARLGIYSPNDLQMVSADRLAKYFTKVDGHYRVNKQLREICVFAPHNIFKDPPFSRVDVISCCNVLIYLNSILQRKVMSNFHYALNQMGILVLGQSETVGSSAKYFMQIDKKVKVYTKQNEVISRASFDMSMTMPSREVMQVRTKKKVESDAANTLNLESLVDKMILNEFSPPGVVVNHHLDIIQFRGSTSLFLEPAPGQASLNLQKMARSGLAFELRNAALKVLKTKQPIKKTGIDMNHKGNLYQVSFNITPIDIGQEQSLLLIIFEEMSGPVVNENKGRFSKDRRVRQLENELISLREDMRSVLESQEAANEELQSANEEILSSNEELQSINEELETSKEEIESSNEELMTINQELIMRNDQLSEANKYSDAIITTIREAVVILDQNFRVRSANQAFYDTFKMTEKETEGIIIYELEMGDWRIPGLKELLEELIPRYGKYHGLQITHHFKDLGEKVFMVNGKRMLQTLNQQMFYLVAFEDITEHKQAERLLQEREEWLRSMTDSLPVMIWVATPDKNFSYLNKTWLAFTGRSIDNEVGIGWTEGIYEEDIKFCLTTYHSAFDKKTPFKIEYRMKRYDGQYRWVLNAAVPSYNSDNVFTGYIGSVTEIHDKRVMTDELERLVKNRTKMLEVENANFNRTNDELKQFAFIASHDFQEPLRKIITYVERFKQKDVDGQKGASDEYLDKILKSTNRLSHLINDLTKLVQASNFESKVSPTNLNEIVQDVLADVELIVQEKDARVDVDELPVIDAIPMHMRQLFYNIIENALKFTGDNQPVIKISFKTLLPEDVEQFKHLEIAPLYYQITIGDNGIGFDGQFADDIFVIFKRLHARNRFEGTGIGLAICKKIIENHGGAIRARSDGFDKGAEFMLILPNKN